MRESIFEIIGNQGGAIVSHLWEMKMMRAEEVSNIIDQLVTEQRYYWAMGFKKYWELL